MKRIILIFFTLPVVLLAEDNPVPIPLEKYARLWENSPFELGVAKSESKPTGIAAEWLLTSISKVGDKPVVTLFNRASNESTVLSPGLNGTGGLELVDADVKEDFLQSSVHIRRGTEVAKFTFQQNELNALQKNQPLGIPHPPVPGGLPPIPVAIPTPPPGAMIPPPPGSAPVLPNPPKRVITRPPNIGP